MISAGAVSARYLMAFLYRRLSSEGSWVRIPL